MVRHIQICRSTQTDPYLNLAVEEYLLNHVDAEECILYLWQNRNTVVIGKNQNAARECRIEEMEHGGVTLARRLSGGGAVFHDMGNLNFTFLVRKENYDVSRQLDVIIGAAAKFGIKAEKTGRNDITADGRKFSGNAFYKSGDRCYHHGTLLLNVDMDKMSKYLQPSEAKLSSKGVESVRSRVINLSELNDSMTADTMSEAMKRSFEEVYGCRAAEIAIPLQNPEIEVLEKKFASWDWRFGRLAEFKYSYEKRFDWGEAQLHLDVESGIVTKVVFNTDSMESEISGVIESALTGCRFVGEEMRERLKREAQMSFGDVIRDIISMI